MATEFAHTIGGLGLTVIGCTGNGVSPIVLTVSGSTASVRVGQRIVVASVGGNTNANGVKIVTVVSSNSITFSGTGNGAYTSGGTVARDYLSIDAWNAATRTINLTGLDRVYRGFVCNDTGYRSAVYAVPSDAINNAQTDETRYRELIAWPEDRFDPFERTGVLIEGDPTTSVPYILRINERGFRIVGIAIKTTFTPSTVAFSGIDTTTWLAGVEINRNGVVLDSCYIDVSKLRFSVSGALASRPSAAIHATATSDTPSTARFTKILNCIVIGAKDNLGTDTAALPVVHGIRVDTQYASISNNLVLGFETSQSNPQSVSETGGGIWIVGGANQRVVNNVVVDCERSFKGAPAASAIISRNASSDDNAQFFGIESVGGLRPDRLFRYYEFGDYRNLAGNALADRGGAALTDDTFVATDFAGDARVAPHEIGPFNGVVAADTRTPTIIESDIGPGLDYDDLEDWEAATAINLVSANVIHRAVIKTTSPMSTGSLDLTEWALYTGTASGSIVDRWRYREITVGEGFRYDPVLDSGAVLTGELLIGESHVRLSGFAITNDTITLLSHAVCIYVDGSSNVWIDGVYGTVPTQAAGGIVFEFTSDATDALITNCIAVGGSTSTGAYGGFLVEGLGSVVANCAAIRCRNSIGSGETPFGFSDGATTGVLFRNCMGATPGTGACFDVASGYQDHNLTTDATAAGVGSIASATASAVWVASTLTPPDLRLLASSPAVNTGVDLSGTFDSDFAGGQRSGAWEIGPYGGYAEPPAWPVPSLELGGSVAWAWSIQRTDGLTLTFSDAPISIVHRGLTHEPGGAFDASARRGEVGMADSSANFRGAITSEAITQVDLLNGLYDDAVVFESMIDGEFPWRTHYWRRQWRLGRIAFDGERFNADVLGASSILERRVGRSYTRACSHVLGDAQCKVDLRAITQRGVAVTSVSDDRRVFRATGLPAAAEDYYTLGVVTWTSGNNAGLRSEVIEFDNSTEEIALALETEGAIQVGDTFDIVPGDDLSFETCRDKFSNSDNFGGFKSIPGTDKTLQTPRSS